MGLEGGSAVSYQEFRDTHKLHACWYVFPRVVASLRGNFPTRRGRAATLNFWRGVPWGKAAIADFLAENLLRGEGSYRQFWEKRALGEGSYRRFFGREFAEPAACEGRLAKGNKHKKVQKIFQKKHQKRSKMLPWTHLGAN